MGHWKPFGAGPYALAPAIKPRRDGHTWGSPGPSTTSIGSKHLVAGAGVEVTPFYAKAQGFRDNTGVLRKC